MYLPRHFEETEQRRLIQLIRSAPLATLIVTSDAGIEANHIPFVLMETDSGQHCLRAHIPRANPLYRIIQTSHDCLAIFYGPNGYVSPSWYASKKVDGKVVPTWNYSVVHAQGRIRVVDEAQWVRDQLLALTQQNEAAREHSWQVDDAPASFTAAMIKGLVGLEIEVERLVGKSKMSQNQPYENQKSVLDALQREQPESALTAEIKSVLAATITPADG